MSEQPHLIWPFFYFKLYRVVWSVRIVWLQGYNEIGASYFSSLSGSHLDSAGAVVLSDSPSLYCTCSLMPLEPVSLLCASLQQEIFVVELEKYF